MNGYFPTLVALAVLLPLFPQLARAQSAPAWTEQHGAFAFPDNRGGRLLATAEIATPVNLRTALCSGNRRVTVRFNRRQPESRTNIGRQSPSNFDNTGGLVFDVVDGTVDPNGTCFLTSESMLAVSTAVTLTKPIEGARCSRDRYPQYEVDKGRPVVGCWPIAESPSGIQIAIIEFARRLTHALASLVVVDGARRTYVDYPAEFNGPGADLWRVDDGGEIHAGGFEIVFMLKRGSSYALGVSWAGAEGLALSVLSAADDSQFEETITDSWYRSPP